MHTTTKDFKDYLELQEKPSISQWSEARGKKKKKRKKCGALSRCCRHFFIVNNMLARSSLQEITACLKPAASKMKPWSPPLLAASSIQQSVCGATEETWVVFTSFPSVRPQTDTSLRQDTTLRPSPASMQIPAIGELKSQNSFVVMRMGVIVMKNWQTNNLLKMLTASVFLNNRQRSVEIRSTRFKRWFDQKLHHTENCTELFQMCIPSCWLLTHSAGNKSTENVRNAKMICSTSVVRLYHASQHVINVSRHTERLSYSASGSQWALGRVWSGCEPGCFIITVGAERAEEEEGRGRLWPSLCRPHPGL